MAEGGAPSTRYTRMRVMESTGGSPGLSLAPQRGPGVPSTLTSTQRGGQPWCQPGCPLRAHSATRACWQLGHGPQQAPAGGMGWFWRGFPGPGRGWKPGASLGLALGRDSCLSLPACGAMASVGP